MRKNMNPYELTPELRSLIKSVVTTKVWVETVHPIVTGYQKAILKEIDATDNEGKPITDPRMSYRMDDAKAEIYFARCVEEADKKKLRHEPDCCPLLEAENLERKAKKALGEYMIPRLPGFENMTYDNFHRFAENEDGDVKRDKLGRMMFKSDELIEISLRLFVPRMADELMELTNCLESPK